MHCIERKHPLVWELEDGTIKRVLDPTMDKGDQLLLLLHSKPSWVSDNDLFRWVEYSSLSMFRRRILLPFHKSRFIEFDGLKGLARISPLGIKEVEQRILKTRS